MARAAPTALSRFWTLFSGNAQQQHVEQDATAIQIEGDDNVVILSREAKLHSEFRHRRAAAPRDLRDLLQPELQAIERVGRQEEFAALQAWTTTRHQGRDIAVHCVTGQAGAGKTRLAIELCAWAEATGWSAGFVRQAELARFHQNLHASEWRWQRPTLIVIDYAAASGRLLLRCLDELAAGEPARQEPALRILLLERHADRDAGWWGELVAADAARGPHTLIEPGKPLALGPLLSPQHRRALLEQAMAKAAPLFDPPILPPPLPSPGADKLFDDALANAAIEVEPLFLLMAGIVAVDTGAPAALATGRLGLADRVVAHERRRLEHVADGAEVDPTLFWHLVACITLQNGCDIDEATTLVEDECRALGERSAPRPDRLVALLRVALPPPQGEGTDAVRPDLIGRPMRRLVPGIRPFCR